MHSIRCGIVSRKEQLKESVDLVVFYEEDIHNIRERLWERFIDDASEYAVENQVCLVPGLYIREGYLCMCIIDKSGNVMGEQRSTHLNNLFFKDLRRGDTINLIDAPFGKVFLSVDIDIYKPEVIRAAVLMGADLAASVQYISNRDYCEEMVLAGAWQQSQQNCLYILNSSNIGGNIIGPCQSTEDLSGFISRSQGTSIYGELDWQRRRDAYRAFPILDSLNKKLYQSHREELKR